MTARRCLLALLVTVATAVGALASPTSASISIVTPTPIAENPSTPDPAHDSPSAATTPAANTHTDPARSNRSTLRSPRSSNSLVGLRGATKGTAVVLARDRDRLLHAAQDPRLRDAISQLYRRDAKVGSGSAMDAFRYEQRTGQMLSPKGHGLKLMERRTQLQRMFRGLEGSDRRIARDLMGDIQDALGSP
jgi:hypothetical protein